MRLIDTWKKRCALSNLNRQYKAECNDLACYQLALKASIQGGNDKLSTLLRDAIVDSKSECSKLKTKIELLKEWLDAAKNVRAK